MNKVSSLLINWKINVAPDHKLNFSELLQIAGGCFLGVTLIYVGKVWYSYRFFKKRGLKTPKYEFFFGNFRELYKNKNYSDVIRHWTKSLGVKTYGYFEGHLPILVTSDPEIIQDVFIKQYANFSARKVGTFTRGDNGLNHLFDATKLNWKKMRTIMNPTFSSAKLRELDPLLNICTDRLIKALDDTNSAEINIHNYFKYFTMDSIWNCAFGEDINMQNNTNNEYFVRCEHVFKIQQQMNVIRYIAVYFHEFKRQIFILMLAFNQIVNFFNPSLTRPFFWINTHVGELVKKRKQDKKKSKRDYLQLLIDAEDNNFSKVNQDIKYNIYIDKKLKIQEIELNLLLFMLAGYETTSTTLAYSAYVLATFPEEQKKLFDEISSVFDCETNIEPNTDNVAKLEYLDMFIKEVLRMYPIGNSVVTRRCTNPTTIKGIDIPLNLTIAIDVLSLHYDSEIWGPIDPNIFHPLRFSPDIKRNPMAYLAFGIGPRNCIGMKFALVELKIAFVKLLRNFEFLPCQNTPKELAFVEGTVRAPINGISVILKKRLN